MSDADVERNRQLLGQLATGPVVRSFLRHPHKLIVTALHLASGTSAGDAAPRLRQFHPRLLGAPVVAFHTGSLFAFELFDLDRDPGEQHNLLDDGGAWRAELTSLPWAADVSMPDADGADVDLATMVSGQ